MSQQHWDSIYSTTELQQLGWYQAKPAYDLALLEELDLDKDASIVIAGAGRSTLIRHLVDRGYTNLTLTDVSEVSLSELKEEINHPDFTWVHDDLTQPTTLLELDNIDLWYDRAVLHFFLEEEDRQQYADLITSAVRSGGYVVLGQFSTDGASRCSGLDVYQYDKEKLVDFIGEGYQLKKVDNMTYINPSGGKRPYIYTIFQKQ